MDTEGETSVKLALETKAGNHFEITNRSAAIDNLKFTMLSGHLPVDAHAVADAYKGMLRNKIERALSLP